MSSKDNSRANHNQPSLAYWLLGAILMVYVAACTDHRDNIWGADAWEHHRVFKALTEDLWHPGNPTYAIDTPSARYTPYAVFWASVCRATGLDPYKALSLGATVNMVVLIAAVPLLLGRFGEAGSSAAALLMMVSLYGGIPGTTNSYALADLPWHMVNFSAASFAWALILLGVFRGFVRREWGTATIPLMVLLSAMTMLDHPMTGSWGQFGLWLLALTAPADQRKKAITTLLVIEVCTLLLCLAWPWYSFRAAMGIKIPPMYVPFGIQHLMCKQWCVPAMILGVFALTLRNREAIRVFLLGGYLSYLAGLLAFVFPSRFPLITAVSRFPMPGLIYLHLSLGIFAHQTGLFRLATWPGRIRTLLCGERDAVARSAIEVVLAAAIAYFLVPQVFAVLSQPHLMRPYLARAMHKENKQLDLLPRFRSLLQGVGRQDVVLSDDVTMWCVPSANGRIVHSFHTELFVPVDEEQRQLCDVESFFKMKTDDIVRIDVLRRYGVRWIILNRNHLDPTVFDHLLVDPAVVRRDDFLVLMDAELWIEQTRKRVGVPIATEKFPTIFQASRSCKRRLSRSHKTFRENCPNPRVPCSR